MDKLVIVQYADGLRQIAGPVSELLAGTEHQRVPSEFRGVLYRGKVMNLKLAKIEPKYLIYQEVALTPPPEDDGA